MEKGWESGLVVKSVHHARIQIGVWILRARVNARQVPWLLCNSSLECESLIGSLHSLAV